MAFLLGSVCCNAWGSYLQLRTEAWRVCSFCNLGVIVPRVPPAGPLSAGWTGQGVLSQGYYWQRAECAAK